jgi:hypothetical protein
MCPKRLNFISRLLLIFGPRNIATTLGLFSKKKIPLKDLHSHFFPPILCQLEVVKICPKKAGISFLDYYYFLALEI